MISMWPGAWRDRERRPRLHHRLLRRHPARPEHRHVAGLEARRGRRGRGASRSAMPSSARVADVHGRAVHGREARGDLDGGGHERRRAPAASTPPAGPTPRPRPGSATTSGTSARSTPCSTCRTGTPAAASARSKVKLQPMRKLTRSARQTSRDVGRLGRELAVHPDAVARARRCGCRRRRAARRPRPRRSTSSTGQGRGLRWAKSRKSQARSRGTAIRLACV